MSSRADCGESESEGKGRLKRHGAERFYAAFFCTEALQINGSRECSSARRRQTLHSDEKASPKTHVQTSQASRGTLAASYVRTSAARGNFQARAHHASPRTPPLVDASSLTPRSPYVAEASGAHRAGAPRATGTRASRKRASRFWGGFGTSLASAALVNVGATKAHRRMPPCSGRRLVCSHREEL